MTREKLEELNELWEKLDGTVAVINLLKNIEEDGGFISTSKNQVYLSPETVKRLLRTMWEYNYQLSKEFEEM